MFNRDLISSASLDPVQRLERTQAAMDRVSADATHHERLATLGLLAAAIAHEINNILTPALAYAQMAAARPDDPAMRDKAIEKAIHGIESATRIAGAVLGFSGRTDECEAEVADVVQASLDCLARTPDKSRIKLHVDIQRGIVVRMNPLSLQQVLMNLILNAQAAMKERGGRLTVAALTRADGSVGIRVADTGPGIPKEIAGRIFEPFVTTKRSSESTCGGTGLGLAICRRLVEDAGGTITAMSKPGDGTTFVITLPSPKAQRAKAS
jgi:signal transduction histidine kinase